MNINEIKERELRKNNIRIPDIDNKKIIENIFFNTPFINEESLKKSNSGFMKN